MCHRFFSLSTSWGNQLNLLQSKKVTLIDLSHIVVWDEILNTAWLYLHEWLNLIGSDQIDLSSKGSQLNLKLTTIAQNNILDLKIYLKILALEKLELIEEGRLIFLNNFFLSRICMNVWFGDILITCLGKVLQPQIPGRNSLHINVEKTVEAMNRSVPIDSIVILIALADTYLIIQLVNLCKGKEKKGTTWLTFLFEYFNSDWSLKNGINF